MTEQAEFYVKNEFGEGINVSRMPPGSSEPDLERLVAPGVTEMFPMQGTDVMLIVNTPGGMATTQCYINVVPENGLPVGCMPAASRWELQIQTNKVFPDSPTTVNVTCGEDE
jgi:hypothetical protein